MLEAEENNKSLSFDSKANLDNNGTKNVIDQTNIRNSSLISGGLIDQSRTAQEEEKKVVIVFSLKFFFLLILTFFIIIFNYVIKPVGTIAKIYFLASLAYVGKELYDDVKDETRTMALWAIIVGYLIIFFFPLSHLISSKVYIVTIEERFLMKVYNFLLVLVELIFQIPIPFLYSNRNFSVYLFEQQGNFLFVNSVVVFFVTDYMASALEIIRQIVDSLYFFCIALVKYNKVKSNYNKTFQINMMIVVITFCALQFIGNLIVILFTVFAKPYTRNLNKKNN